MNIHPLAIVVVATFMTGPAQAADFLYSATHGPECTNIESKPELTSWRCRGPAGFSVVFADTGNLIAVEFGPTGKEKAIVDNDLVWQGASKPFGDKIEWRLTAGKPYAAVLRIWRNDPSPESGKDRAIQELLVVKIAPAGACRVGTVSARDRDANTTARALADLTAASFRCGLDAPRIVER